jgi:hypothetical protein
MAIMRLTLLKKDVGQKNRPLVPKKDVGQENRPLVPLDRFVLFFGNQVA